MSDRWFTGLFALVLASMLAFSAAGAFAGGAKEGAKVDDEVYTFTHAYAVWELTQGRLAVEEQPDNPYWQYLAKTLGTAPLTISWKWEGGMNYMKELRLLLASGDIPDSMKAWDLDFTREIIEGGITIPLDDLLKEHGPNILKAFREEDWDIMRALSPDGKIHAIPNIMGIHRSRSGHIRKDWLDKLGMGVPKTRDELVAAYKGFKEQDVNGNGDPNDEIPVSGRKGMRWLDDLFVMHGVVMYEGHPQWKWDKAKGQMVNEQVSDEMRNAIEFLRSLVEKGYMDKVMPIQPAADWWSKMNSNRLGHYFHLLNTLDQSSAFKQEHPDASYVAMPPPLVPGVGPQNSYVSSTYVTELMITNKAKQPEKIIQWMNYYFTPEGQAYYELGIPGVNWAREGGKIKLLEPRTQFYIWGLSGVPYNEELLRLTQLGDEKVTSVNTLKNRINWTWANIGMPRSVFSGYEDYLPKKSKLFREHGSKIVLGELPMSAWDDYVKEWKSRGGETVVQRATEWYKKTKLGK